jgi:hypothetical protein
MSTNPDDCNGTVDDLPDDKRQILRDWEVKFMGKYRVVGALAGSGIDLSQYEDQMKDSAEGEEHKPTGHKAPLVIGVTAVLGAAVAFAASLIAAKFAG